MKIRDILSFFILLLVMLSGCYVEENNDENPEGIAITTVVANPPIVTPQGSSNLIVQVTNHDQKALNYEWHIKSGGGSLTEGVDTPTEAHATFNAPNYETTVLIEVTAFVYNDRDIYSSGSVVVTVRPESGVNLPGSIDLLIYEADTQTLIPANGQTDVERVDIVARSTVPTETSIRDFNLIANGGSYTMQISSNQDQWQGRKNDFTLINHQANTFQVFLNGSDGTLLAQSSAITIYQQQLTLETDELVYDSGTPEVYWGTGGGQIPTNYVLGVRMTPSEPAKVLQGKFYIGNTCGGAQFKAQIYSFDGDSPGYPLGTAVYVTPQTTGWVTADFGDQNITVSGDFMMTMTWLTNNCPALGSESTSNIQRSWDYNGNEWLSYFQEVYFIRAVVGYNH